MSYRHLTIDKRDHIALVTLNRPERANALNFEHLSELEHCALSFREDADTRVVIFTGAGRHFSSGADLVDFPDELTQPLVVRRRRFRIGERALHAMLGIDQITIAAWNGGALGGGACLVTAADFRIGDSNCFIQYPEIDLGMNLMWQSLPLTVHLLGPTRAKRLVIGGERVHAPTLLEWGLLEEVAAPAELLDRARAFAATYVNKSPIAAQMIKRSVNQVMGALDRALMHMDADQNLLTHTSADQKAAAAAYAAKTEPRFSGD
ncbi:MAG: enoyl-CoA hydratase/isomerase family protein [Proteobacteria bacterium]|nr:enoyl-CoA hydratase/isomerase family protein [Pseudomonadota bacterium]